jgi:thiamine-phosphate pyrophosphorylase
LPSVPDRPIVCYVTNGRDFPGENRHEQTVRSIRVALEAGADWVQIREKDLNAAPLLALVRDAVEIAAPQESARRTLVNDRLDIALAAGASGVHLRAESALAEAVVGWCREGNAPAGFLVGLSCHTPQQARAAAAAGVDYVFFGPIFDSPAKREFGRPQGIERLREVCGAVTTPVIAIGGINEQNAAACVRAGASGVAAIRLFQPGPEPVSLTQIVSQIHAIPRFPSGAVEP